MDYQAQQAFDAIEPSVDELQTMWHHAQYVPFGLPPNIVGAMNICQSKFDKTTFWQRNDDGKYYAIHYADINACAYARHGSISRMTCNNRILFSEADHIDEQNKAFAALYAYNAAKYSEQTIKGTARQKAAQRGAMNRKLNKAKRAEDNVKNLIKQLFALKHFEGVRDEQYDIAFDKTIGDVLIALNSKLDLEAIRAEIVSDQAGQGDKSV